jgi:hypothetical protein
MKYKIIIVSDLHLGTKDSKSKEFIEFLDNHPTELLILNGDIVDGWALSRGSKWKKNHTKVISKILKISKNTKVVWVRGNHDEFLNDFIGSKFGNIEIVEDYKIELFSNTGGDNWQKTSYLVFHGDIIDIFITKYKWLSKIGSIGYDLALWLNRLYNKYRKFVGLDYQSISKKIKSSIKVATNYINDFETCAIRTAKSKGCDGAICGHIHQPANYKTSDGHYLNSGDWVENKTALLIDYNYNIEIYYQK